ncbi:hypothetical protein K4H28_14530 [Deefgea tanakiae]|uniref:Wadjet protein JetD C-terminal domain-containing protein n=1 Tax=Deefgea tanakiae TaxID=2865840 RepID=A0ABX8Z6Q9_9NEIS|nr:DUF2220 family protein [Deefgea tanakiae]QZA77480.1 hypothetical protein K4H28_14530 [Deefgea tanakiae]
MDETCSSLLAWLRRISGTKARKLLAAGVASRAAGGLQIDLVSVLDALQKLRASGLISYKPDIMGMPYTGYLTVVPAVVNMSITEKTWLEALEVATVENALLSEALAASYSLFEGLDAQDMGHVIAGLQRIESTSQENVFGFSVSAQHVLGSSKILSRLPLSTLRLLGAEHFPSTPRYIVVAGPPDPIGVLLIENTTSFELAVQAGLDKRLALVASYGYGLNTMSDSCAGLALVESVLRRECQILSRTGSNHNLSKLFALPRILFWGDLDREGLRIAMALKQQLPQLELSALYLPMRMQVHYRETSHPYVALSGKAAQLPWLPTGDKVFDDLASACSNRAVDQEAVDLKQYGHLAQFSITEMS